MIVAPDTDLRPAKNQHFDQAVLVGLRGAGRDWLGECLVALRRRALRGGATRLFPQLSQARFLSLFKRAAEEAGLGQLQPTPHMLRHGGPSQDMLMQDIAKVDVASRGRWACLQSCNRYEKRGRLVRQLAKLSAA